jgi:hypothetical protein
MIEMIQVCALIGMRVEPDPYRLNLDDRPAEREEEVWLVRFPLWHDVEDSHPERPYVRAICLLFRNT